MELFRQIIFRPGRHKLQHSKLLEEWSRMTQKSKDGLLQGSTGLPSSTTTSVLNLNSGTAAHGKLSYLVNNDKHAKCICVWTGQRLQNLNAQTSQRLEYSVVTRCMHLNTANFIESEPFHEMVEIQKQSVRSIIFHGRMLLRRDAYRSAMW